MGNNPSSESENMSYRARIHQKKNNHISWEEFRNAVREMNTHCMTNKDKDGEYLCFALNKNVEMGIFWRAKVKIMCFKVNTATRRVLSCKQLTYPEFMNAYNVKKSIPDPMAQTAVLNEMATSTYIFRDTADSEGYCVICMENDNRVLLPCLHSFCMVCIAQELEFRPQFSCPICKARIEHPIEDSWEVPDIPEGSEVNQYLAELAK